MEVKKVAVRNKVKGLRRKSVAEGKKKRTAKQQSLFPKPKREHGGSHSHGKRRSYRPMNRKLSLNITLSSKHAVGPRCLFLHKKTFVFIMRKFSRRFNVKIINYAFAGNHLHLHIKGESRLGLQNFFRVFAGHTAQRILKDFPLTKPKAGGAPQEACEVQNKGCKKNQRKFWQFLIYSRIVSKGADFRNVNNYIEKNILETLRIIAYEPRNPRSKANSS